MSNPGFLKPDKCVECFNQIDPDEIICGKCQDELDGRFDDLREKESS